MSDGWLVKSAGWVENHHLYIAQQAGPIVLSVVAVWVGIWLPEELEIFSELENKPLLFWASQWTPWSFLLLFVISVYGGFWGVVQSKKKDRRIEELNTRLFEYESLPNQLEEAQLAIDEMRIWHEETVFNVTSDYLAHLSKDRLNYNDTERVSLYLHNGARFILVGRFSESAEFTKRNRSAFPDDEGCIGQTWRHGGEYFTVLPADDDEYCRILKTDLGIGKGTARQLRMKSLSYCSFALTEGYRRIGVIMFESSLVKALDQDDLRRLVDEHQGYLIEMLKRAKLVNALVAYQNGGE